MSEVPGFILDFVEYLVGRFFKYDQAGGGEAKFDGLVSPLRLTSEESDELKDELHRVVVDAVIVPILGGSTSPLSPRRFAVFLKGL